MFHIDGKPLPTDTVYCENEIDLDQELYLLSTHLKYNQLHLFEQRKDRFPRMVSGYIQEGQPFPTLFVTEYIKLCDSAYRLWRQTHAKLDNNGGYGWDTE